MHVNLMKLHIFSLIDCWLSGMSIFVRIIYCMFNSYHDLLLLNSEGKLLCHILFYDLLFSYCVSYCDYIVIQVNILNVLDIVNWSTNLKKKNMTEQQRNLELLTSLQQCRDVNIKYLVCLM